MNATIQKQFELLAKQRAELEEKQVNKENYDPSQSRVDLCEFISEALNPIYSAVAVMRQREMSFASNEEVNPQDFDNLFHVIGQLYRLCDSIQIEAGVQDEYTYSTQKNFD